MKNFKLLPHWCQNVGWGFVGGGVTLLLYSLFMEVDSDAFFASTQWAFGCALKTIGFLMVAFSCESFEDERINSIRLNTLGLIAVVYAVMLITYPIMDFLLVFFSLASPMLVGEIVAVRGIVGVLPLYVIIFKLTIWFKNKDLCYEE